MVGHRRSQRCITDNGHELSMLYDTCGILDLIQSIIIPSHRQNMALIPEAVTAHLTAD